MAYVDTEKRRVQWNAWYAKTKTEQLPKIYASRKARKLIKQAWINEYKSNTPCADCGNCFPAICMDFDHLRDKTYNISRMAVANSKETIVAEMAKCELVCANCHRIRTQNRLSDGVTGSTQGFGP